MVVDHSALTEAAEYEALIFFGKGKLIQLVQSVIIAIHIISMPDDELY
ncbi:hypothetical protein KO116_P100258 (plasmid) [Halomonas sp. KO116]|nr:hypothetical protein KO116_P100258 [Halomonas sp. KO116]